jgi:hypothetical protein
MADKEKDYPALSPKVNSPRTFLPLPPVSRLPPSYSGLVIPSCIKTAELSAAKYLKHNDNSENSCPAAKIIRKQRPISK